MIGFKFLKFTGASHDINVIARTYAEAVARNCDPVTTTYWWSILTKADGTESVLMIKDTPDDKANLTGAELTALIDIQTTDADWFEQP